MNMMTHRPQSLIAQFMQELRPDVFGKSWLADFPQMPLLTGSQWQPAVDIEENDKEFIVRADIPGVDPKNIDVHIDNGVLFIRGERETERKEETDKYKRVEREWGSFERRFTLPEFADADHIKAKSMHGVLELRIPKIAGKKGNHKIQIETKQ